MGGGRQTDVEDGERERGKDRQTLRMERERGEKKRQTDVEDGEGDGGGGEEKTDRR